MMTPDTADALDNAARQARVRLGEQRDALDRTCDDRIKALVAATLPEGGDA